MTLTVFDPATLQVPQGVVTMAGPGEIHGEGLTVGTRYAAVETDAAGNVQGVMFPLVAV